MSSAQWPATPHGERTHGAPAPAPATPAAPQAPSSLGVQPASTAVAAAIGLLDTLRDLPLAEHPDVYQRVHAELQGALADIDDA